MKTYWIVLTDCTSLKNTGQFYKRGAPNTGLNFTLLYGYSLWYDVILVDNIHDNINVLDSALWAETILKLNVFVQFKTRSSAVAERLRDASCH